MKNIALLIDLENVSLDIIDHAVDHLNSLGTIKIKRAYGDFSYTSSNLANWKTTCLKHNIEIIHHFSCKANKNSSDILLAIDAMDILHNGDIDTFCIVSSDSDFSSLIQRLKKSQCDVIGMGNIPPNEHYKLLFEQFYDFSQPTVKEIAQLPVPEIPSQIEPPFWQKKWEKFAQLFTHKDKPATTLEVEKTKHPIEQSSVSIPPTQERKIVHTTFNKCKKNGDGYVDQAHFASKLTDEQRALIKGKYKHFSRFVQECHYLTIKKQQGTGNYLIKVRTV
ncbi:hypothetical protein A1D22_01900 [Pasteurellaceae bacterium LFhippo2]|nr:hypothetical protein [Pasteurellaceae bacterium LFhippo2]